MNQRAKDRHPLDLELLAQQVRRLPRQDPRLVLSGGQRPLLGLLASPGAISVTG
jgi:hypothetical protein